MARKVSMTDIARRLNVSQATVSYVLSGREGGLVGERTRQRVLEAAQEMGYRRNRAAQALSGHGSDLIELCVNGFHPAFYARVLDAFAQQLRATPYQLHIVNPLSGSQKGWAASDSDWPVDGVILFDVHLPDSALPALQQRAVPVVSTGIYPSLTVDNVFVNLTPALMEGLRHIAAQSRRVAYVSAWPTHGPEVPDPRYPAYRQVMREAQLQEEVIVTPEQANSGLRASVREIMREYVTQNGAPDAIFCFNDERAIATLAALRDLHLRVPEDVLLLGCDNIEETAYHDPAISTIQFPFGETARQSWQFLKNRIDEPDLPRQSATLQAQLLLRESSAR